MALNYANAVPVDERGNPMQGLPPPVIALATTTISTAISSVVTLNNNTTDIEVSAPNIMVAIKWIGVNAAQTSVISSSLGTANFDHTIPSGTYRKFVVPRETQGMAGPALTNSIHGLYQRLALIPINGTGVASILVTEY